MRIIYAGTPPFAVPALEALHAAGHEIVAVFTQPDRPAGRGMKLTPSAVAQRAAGLGIPLEKPATLKSAEARDRIAALAPEAMVVAAYGLILPRDVLAIPPRGCLNIHASLLPRWRGAAPIHRALLAGDARTGVSIMQMEAGLDTGPVLLERVVEIPPDATTGSLTALLAAVGAEAVVEALALGPELVPRPQDDAHATYAAKITRDEARIDWHASAAEIERRVRAFDPQPGAEAVVAGETLKIWRATRAEGRGAPGTVLESEGDAFVVACGEAALRLEIVQRPGGRRLAAADFLRGRSAASARLG